MRQFLRIFGATALLLLFASQELRADFKLLDAIEEFGEKRFIKSQPSRLNAGPLKFHPFLHKSIQYDDNILLEPKDKRSDIVYNIKPGAIIELPIKKHQLAVGYESEFELFTKRRHRQQNDANQNFFALTDFRFTNWYVNMLEYFSETSSRAGTTFTNRIPRYEQSVNPKVGYKWRRTTFEAGFRHYVRDFRPSTLDAFDFQVTEFTGVIFYDLFSRLKALVDYQFAQIDYDDDSTRYANINQMRLGLEGEIYKNVFMKFRTGPQLRNYTTSSEQDFKSIIGSFQLDYQVRNNLKLRTKLSREPVEATYGSVNFYTEHYASAGFDFSFLPRWTLYHDTAFFKQHYSEREFGQNQFGFRRDSNLALKSGIRYQFREWWQFDASYEFLHRDSNFSDFGFNDNRFSLSSNLAY